MDRFFAIVWLGFVSSVLAGTYPHLRVLPVGDSITRGSYLVSYTNGSYAGQGIGLPDPANGGWRKPLQDKLRAAGNTFEFLGELDYLAYGSNGVVDASFDPHHQGLAGFSNLGILTGGSVPTPKDVLDAKGVTNIVVHGIVTVLTNDQPNVVLLMSGANGFDATARDRLIRTIMSNTTAQVLVATILPECPPRSGYEQVEPYNQSLPQIVAELQGKGYPIHMVDMYSALSTSDLLSDGVHPNAGGMAKMAQVWFEALGSIGLTQAPTNDAGPASPGSFAYMQAVTSSQPVAYFRLNEASGSYYSSVGAFTGTPTSITRVAGPSFTNAGRYGTLQFPGLESTNRAAQFANLFAPTVTVAYSYVTVPHSVALNPGTNSLTLEAWLNLTSPYTNGGEGEVLMKIGDTNYTYRSGYALSTAYDPTTRTMRVFGQMRDGEYVYSNALFLTPRIVLSTGVWHHVAAVFARNPPNVADTATLYVDGQPRGASTGAWIKIGKVVSGGPQDIQGLGALGLGCAVPYNGTRGLGMSGGADEIALYKRALPADEIFGHWLAARYPLRTRASCVTVR